MTRIYTYQLWLPGNAVPSGSLRTNRWQLESELLIWPVNLIPQTEISRVRGKNYLWLLHIICIACLWRLAAKASDWEESNLYFGLIPWCGIVEYYELYKFCFEIRMFCDSGDFQIRKHLKIGNEVEGSNCFNIAWLFICSAPFLAKACVSPGRGPTRRSKSLCHIAWNNILFAK